MQTPLCSSPPCSAQTSLCQTSLQQTPLCSSPPCSAQTPLCQASPKQTPLCPSSVQTPLCQVSLMQTPLCSSPVQTPHCQASLKQTSLCPTSQDQRLNTDLLYPLNSSNILSSSTANVLHPQNIAHLLQQYSNRQFVETLVSIATSGVRIGYEGSPSAQIHRPNHTSAFAHPEIIINMIQSEIKTKRIKEIKNLSTNYYYSSIDLISKSIKRI